ncbi:hypothetical protein BSIN_0894 [Burkholderia singularis]|uniref:Uncharacterized protein n=1 Tax=Burkholderia singularis TaxID=1503053 RepID=A0A238HAA4_9BURK|nr:hypothetical protein BSIN_0894 [Burkholderia singularis]
MRGWCLRTSRQDRADYATRHARHYAQKSKKTIKNSELSGSASTCISTTRHMRRTGRALPPRSSPQPMPQRVNARVAHDNRQISR